MKKSVIVRLAAPALVLGTAVVAARPAISAYVSTPSATSPRAAKGAASQARRAEAALRASKPAAAIAAAEAAVALAPRDATLRVLLGRSYLAAGRFVSARTSFADAVALDPAVGRARLSLALAQIATGDVARARETLATTDNMIGDADRGLALALAGDPDGAVRLLEAAARAPEADAKTRQNLAFAYALAGEWAKSQATAMQDLSPAAADVRMTEWAKLAQPGASIARVAALLGVTPAADAGQPAALALAAPAAPVPAVAAVAVTASEPPPAAATVAVVPVAAPVSPAVPVKTAAAPAAPLVEPPHKIFYAPPAVYAALPPLIRAPQPATKIALRDAPRVPALLAAPRRIAYALPAQQERGGWVIQLGAFSQRTTIDAAWGQVSRRYALLASYIPSHSVVTANNATLTRLTLAGFGSREAAMLVCHRIRRAGGPCFVRAGTDEAPVRMAAGNRPVELASR